MICLPLPLISEFIFSIWTVDFKTGPLAWPQQLESATNRRPSSWYVVGWIWSAAALEIDVNTSNEMLTNASLSSLQFSPLGPLISRLDLLLGLNSLKAAINQRPSSWYVVGWIWSAAAFEIEVNTWIDMLTIASLFRIHCFQ